MAIAGIASDFPNKGFALFKQKHAFISDQHLGGGNTATPYLYEFLQHLDFDVLQDLYLVGDFIGGWEFRRLPEMEKRVLDVINFAAANNVRVHYLPGNHDESLRRPGLMDMLNRRTRFTSLPAGWVFENEAYLGRTKIVHGDEGDPALFASPWFKPLMLAANFGTNAVARAQYLVPRAIFKSRVYLSCSQIIGQLMNFSFKHESLVEGLSGETFDTVLMGHLHEPKEQEFEHKGQKSFLVNIGDWKDSCTWGASDSSDDIPKVHYYKLERELRGLGDLPVVEDEHPAQFAAMRPATDRQVRLIHRLWPTSSRARQVNAYNHALNKLAAYQADRQALQAIIDGLNRGRLVDQPARDRLLSILFNTKNESYPVQKKELPAIFARHAVDDPLNSGDYEFARVVVREFCTRADRKIHKHRDSLRQAADRLNYQPSILETGPWAKPASADRSHVSASSPASSLSAAAPHPHLVRG